MTTERVMLYDIHTLNKEAMKNGNTNCGNTTAYW